MAKRPTFPDCFDEVRQISICTLRDLGYMERSSKVGDIVWTRGDRETGRVGLTVDMSAGYIRLRYLVAGKLINYRVLLDSIPSNLGRGRVWYFVCPETGRRCRKLYFIGKYFLSRFAYPYAMYSKQTDAKGFRNVRAAIDVIQENDRRCAFLSQRYAKPYYNGKPTRRFQRLLDREDRAFQRFSNTNSSELLPR